MLKTQLNPITAEFKVAPQPNFTQEKMTSLKNAAEGTRVISSMLRSRVRRKMSSVYVKGVARGGGVQKGTGENV